MSVNTVYHNTVRVYVEDVDYMGVVYHANYLCYFERSRTEILRTHNVHLSDLVKKDILFAISALEVNYKFPARLDDLLTVSTEITNLKACTFMFQQRMINQHDQLICTAKINVVCVNSNLKPMRLPNAIKELG